VHQIFSHRALLAKVFPAICRIPVGVQSRGQCEALKSKELQRGEMLKATEMLNSQKSKRIDKSLSTERTPQAAIIGARSSISLLLSPACCRYCGSPTKTTQSTPTCSE
jgi:predicted Zn-ribbon and HTH transcriptional regulator